MNIRTLLLAIGASSLFSCYSTKTIALKGKYPTPPIITMSQKSFDEIWSNTVDFFAQHGIPIKLIDKASGIIVSEKTKLDWSFEDKTGKLIHPRAYVALNKTTDDVTGRAFVPEEVTGEWNIRIKPTDKGTLINVNLYDIYATYGRVYYSEYTHGVIQPIKTDGYTTGIFEKTLEDAVK